MKAITTLVPVTLSFAVILFIYSRNKRTNNTRLNDIPIPSSKPDFDIVEILNQTGS